MYEYSLSVLDQIYHMHDAFYAFTYSYMYMYALGLTPLLVLVRTVPNFYTGLKFGSNAHFYGRVRRPKEF